MCLMLSRMLYLSPIDYRGIFVVANSSDLYVFNLYKSHCVCVCSESAVGKYIRNVLYKDTAKSTYPPAPLIHRAQ